MIGLTQYSTSAHIARATLEAVCYQTRAVLDVIEKESGVKLDELKVDGKRLDSTFIYDSTEGSSSSCQAV